MNSINKIRVTYHDMTVGSLSMTPDKRLCAFQYGKDWLARGFSISPLDLPLKPGMFISKPEPFWGNFGILTEYEEILTQKIGKEIAQNIIKAIITRKNTLN